MHRFRVNIATQQTARPTAIRIGYSTPEGMKISGALQVGIDDVGDESCCEDSETRTCR
jgi:hypothetical protein